MTDIEDAIEAYLPIEVVAERLRRTVRSVRRLCDLGTLAWIPGRPILIRETELWRYLTEAKNIRPGAFGEAPLSQHANAALEAAKSKILADHLAYIELEDARHLRRSIDAAAQWEVRGDKAKSRRRRVR